MRTLLTGAGSTVGTAFCLAVLLLGLVACTAVEGGEVEARLTPSASSTHGNGSPSALVDGDVRARQLAGTWVAAPGDPAPWVQLDFPRERRVSSVQVFGPPGEKHELGQLHGELHFSDGSTVTVASIDQGNGEATTVAFAPRGTSSVRLVLTKTEAQAPVALREMVVYEAGTTPPRWGSEGASWAVDPPKAACDRQVALAAPAAAPLAGELTLACPSAGSAVEDSATVVIGADTGRSVELSALAPAEPSGQLELTLLGRETAEGGLAVLEIPLSNLPSGPLTLRAMFADAGEGERPLDIQLFRTAGRPIADRSAVSHPPVGATLQWDEQFDDPVSITGTGLDATYAASKPEKQGASQFGEAVFADPAAGARAVATVPGGFLRLRAEPIEGRRVNADAGQEALTGFLSSARVGGSGFSAQHGYFEARMYGGPGPGAWPAFWMLDAEAATPRQDGAGEIDVVELYGHATRGSCHTVHDWGVVEGESTAPQCIDPNGFSDWAMSWHTYGAQVTPEETIFTIDGVEVARQPALSKQDEPFFFMVNLALGGGWPVDLNRTGGVSDLYVDWIRVYT